MTLARCIELLNQIVEHVCAANDTTESVHELIRMGFEEDELIHQFNFSKEDVYNAMDTYCYNEDK